MKFVMLFVNILCLNYCLSIANPNNFQMIIDVIESYEQPSFVIAKVCWSKVQIIKLAKILANERLSIRYLMESEDFDDTARNNHLFFVIDSKCPDYKYFLSQASTKKMYSKTYRWLLLGQTAAVVNDAKELDILTDSEFIVAEDQADGNVILQTAYKLKPRTAWILEYYGIWSNTSGLNKSRDRMTSNAMRRKDLKGQEIATSFVITHNRTGYELDDMSNTILDSFPKSNFHLLTNLYEFLNASRVVMFSDAWGYLVNGTWTGMVQDINTGKADLCGVATFMTRNRSAVIEYITVPSNIAMHRIIFRQPPLSYEYNLFLLPFSIGVWYCLGALVIILIITLYITAKWDSRKFEYGDEESIDGNYLGAVWSNVIMFVITAISQQGSPYELKGTRGRTVTFIVFLAFLFFYTSYSACIIVLLQSTSDQIRTLTDLTNSKLEFGMEDVGYNRYYYSPAYARDAARKAFYEKKVASSKAKFYSLEDGVKRLQSSPFAFSMNTGTGYKIVSKFLHEHEKCGLWDIDYIGDSMPWTCIKKGSPYTEMYRIGFYRIEEHGLSARSNQLIFGRKPQCTGTSSTFLSVKMVDFYPVLLMMTYGIILAIAIFILEILVHRRQKMKENSYIN